MQPVVMPCTCTHPYQDAQYGRGQRVHNVKAQKAKSNVREGRCTVCSAVRTVLALLLVLFATTAYADPPGTDCRPYDADARAKCDKDPRSAACADARDTAACCHDVCKCVGDFPAKRAHCGQKRSVADADASPMDDRDGKKEKVCRSECNTAVCNSPNNDGSRPCDCRSRADCNQRHRMDGCSRCCVENQITVCR